MNQEKEGAFKQTFSLDNCTGRFPKDELERVLLFDVAVQRHNDMAEATERAPR
jgi:hypothetical protein